MWYRLIFVILILAFTGCSSAPSVKVVVVNTSDKAVEVQYGDKKPTTLAPTRSMTKKLKSGQTLTAGDKTFELTAEAFGEHRAAVLVAGELRPMLIGDYSDYYAPKGEEIVEDPEIGVIGVVDQEFYPFGDGATTFQMGVPGFLPEYSGKKAWRLVPLPPELSEADRNDYLQREMATVLGNKDVMKSTGLNILGQNRYRRFLPETGWQPGVEELKQGKAVSLTVVNLSPAPVVLRKNEEKLGTLIPKGETGRWLSAKRGDKIRLMSSNGDPVDDSGKVLREFAVDDVLKEGQEHLLVVNDPNQKFEFLLADFTTLAEGHQPVVGETIRSQDDMAVLEPYDLVWGFEKRMPPLPQSPGRVMRLMVIKPEIKEDAYKMWAEAGVKYDLKQMKEGKYQKR